MKCLNDCGNEAKGRSKYCSDKCKVAWNRNKKRNTVTGEAKTVTKPEIAPITQTTDAQEAAGSTKSDEAMQKVAALDPMATVDQPDISLLPPGVSRPTGQRTAKTEAMTGQQLRTRIRYYKALNWIASKEYAEVIHRSLTLSIAQLDEQGVFVPAWRLSLQVLMQQQLKLAAVRSMMSLTWKQATSAV